MRFEISPLHVDDRHGAQGVLDTASNATLDNEFGSHNEDECIKKILEKGSAQESEVRSTLSLSFLAIHSCYLPPFSLYLHPTCVNAVFSLQNAERQGPKNDSMGPMVAH